MIRKVKFPEIKFIPEYENCYEDNSLEPLEESIKSDGVHYPPIVDSEYSLIDGYRRVRVLEKIGVTELEVDVKDEAANLFFRIKLNSYRKKSFADQTFEMRQLFIQFPKKQGSKGEKYSRYDLIRKDGRIPFKDDETISKYEYILENDLDGDILSKGIQKNEWKVQQCYEFLKTYQPIDTEKNYGYTEKLLKGELTVPEVNKFIKERERLQPVSHTYKIPEKCHYYLQDCKDVIKLEEFKGQVDTIVTSIPYYQLENYTVGGSNQIGHEKTKEEYAERIEHIFKLQLPLLKQSANVFINVGETYQNGIGLGIPFLIQEHIKRTGLIYKSTLIYTKKNPKPHGENVKRPYNSVEWILWFVVNPELATYRALTLPRKNEDSFVIGRGCKDVSKDGIRAPKKKNLSKKYTQILSHWSDQDDEKVILTTVGPNHLILKISKEGHPCPMNSLLPIRPILMTTYEDSLIYDPFAGTNMVGYTATLLNRRFFGVELNERFFGIGCEVLTQSNKMFDRNSLDVLNDTVYGTGSDELNKAA
jgi:DNA modification methylase